MSVFLQVSLHVATEDVTSLPSQHESHITSEPTINATSACHVCQKNLKTERGLRQHISRMHPESKLKTTSGSGASQRGKTTNLCKPSVDVEFREMSGPIDDRLTQANWGGVKGAELQALVDNTFLEVARWRRNLFLVPTGKAGEAFIEELTSLINHFVTGSVFEPIALTLVSIFFPLLLGALVLDKDVPVLRVSAASKGTCTAL